MRYAIKPIGKLFFIVFLCWATVLQTYPQSSRTPAENLRINREASLKINGYVSKRFIKFPSFDKVNFPKSTSTLVVVPRWSSNGSDEFIEIYELLDLTWKIWGSPRVSSQVEKSKGINWEFEGGVNFDSPIFRSRKFYTVGDYQYYNWSSYEDSPTKCSLTVQKFVDKELEFSNFRCDLFNGIVSGEVSSLSRGYAESLNARKFYKREAIEAMFDLRHRDYLEALDLMPKVIDRIFSQCDGRWFTLQSWWKNSEDELKDFPDLPFKLFELLDLKPKLEYGLKIDLIVSGYIRYDLPNP